MIKLLITKWIFGSLFVTCTLSTEFAFADSMLITSWNFEWLSSRGEVSTLSKNRTSKDIKMLAIHFRQLSPSILFFQEVDSNEVILNLVGPRYRVYLSDRVQKPFRNHQFHDINQYTGIAVKHGINVEDPHDIRLDKAASSKMRFATYIIINNIAAIMNKEAYPATKRITSNIHLLSVHLKAGCRGRYRKSSSCSTLKQQADKLNYWLRERVHKKESFIMAGDFNHALAFPNDWFYHDLTKTIQNHVILASRKTEAHCVVRSKRNPNRTHKYKNLVDHIVISSDLATSQAKQNVYTKQQVLSYQLSDHCPISVSLSDNEQR
ncbi:endonuclease/exonuclease/phosphatase family protein [Vibrio sp. DW001]|uniref:endonuclease/exonuclease/phosphatase family protein n=1 Tax=Vibrio sp. DW001 TaxID=2912315 RepID=UPI0023B11917|nr:endonuclease/exonuclease/phosphatase family protein [Vibrio sp. DW001]WED29299.1 endonuclease/exonuclease/phosphatase family protein [Vibrio sp. DW001]